MYTLQDRYWFREKPELIIINDKNQKKIELSSNITKVFSVIIKEYDLSTIDYLSNFILRNPVDAIYTNIKDITYLEKLEQLNIPIYITYYSHIFNCKYVNDEIFKDVYTFGGTKKSFMNVLLKRWLDIIGSLLGCMITIPLFFVLVPLIQIESKGNAIFKQKRIGINGRVFNFYKFRSMKENADKSKYKFMKHNEMDSIMFKVENDPRITKVGKFIRKFSLDEFPQFFQVLKGDMSLVGTRPPTLDEFKQYDFHHKSRLNCKPGITGLWQTTGRDREKNFEKIVELDNEYIKKSSFIFDIWIIFKTIFVMFHNK